MPYRHLSILLLLVCCAALLSACGLASPSISQATAAAQAPLVASAAPASSPTVPAAAPAASPTTATSIAPTHTPVPAAEQSKLEIASPVFEPGGPIPKLYSCQGENINPPLAWTGIPQKTVSLALIMDDPDAPMGTWVHWVLYNLPPETTSLPENASGGNKLPTGAIEGKTSFGKPGYGGPCPPSGQHRYFFHLYALDIALTAPSLDKPALLKAIEGHILSQAELMGTYKK